MPADVLRTMLHAPLVARLAWQGEDGPRIVPIWFLWSDGALWFETSPASPVARAVGRRPAVAVEIGDERGGLRVRSITTHGDIALIDEGSVVDGVVRSIFAKYLGVPALEVPAVGELVAAAHVVLRLPLARVTARDETGGIAPLGPQ